MELFDQLGADAMFASSVHQEICRIERDGRSQRVDIGHGVAQLDAEQLEETVVDGFVLLFKLVDEVLDEGVGYVDALLGVYGFEGAEDEVGEVLG